MQSSFAVPASNTAARQVIANDTPATLMSINSDTTYRM